MTQHLKKDEQQKATQKILKEPFIEDFSENTLRIRRNMIAIAGLVLFLKFGDVSITGSAPYLGLKISGLTQNKIDVLLFCVLTYFWIHFFVNSWDQFLEWRLRKTSTNKDLLYSIMERPTPAGIDSGTGAKPDFDEEIALDPKQKTLMSWYVGNQKRLAKLESVLNNNYNDISSSQNIERTLNNLLNYLSAYQEMGSALENFEANFFRYLRFQRWRWMLIEWAGPLVFSCVALIYLLYNVISNI